jgi:phosphoglycolate phosphatase-like HAD superfamily hydrolase
MSFQYRFEIMMKSSFLDSYLSLVFDCDGVVLNSNRIKTEAFRIAALPWGADAADALVAHHVANGGISRYRKFAYFLESIVPLYASSAVPGIDGPGLDQLLASYAKAVHSGLMTCDVAEGLDDLRAQTPGATWCIVSGGDQAEVRDIFFARGLDHFFDGGIFGSPDSKDVILARGVSTGLIRKPALFLGDSLYDHQAANASGLDFIFISGWTEFVGWRNFIQELSLPSADFIHQLIEGASSN